MDVYRLRDYRRRYLAGEPTTMDDVRFYRMHGTVSRMTREETHDVALWRCALDAAATERRAVRVGLRFVWEHDSNAYPDGPDDGPGYPVWRCVVLPADDDGVLACTGCVDLGPDGHPDTATYARVTEAELAAEAFATLDRTVTVRRVDPYHRAIDRSALAGVLTFDQPVRVRADGTVSLPLDVRAPELPAIDHGDEELDRHARTQGWTLLSGWTGQHGYRGPVMHPSEYLGGRLADHVLATPGDYAVVALDDSDDDPGAGGWVVAHRPLFG